MFGSENVSPIFCGECRRFVCGGIKSHLQRGRVRLQQHVRDGCLASEIRSLTGMAGIFMVAHVIPRPAVVIRPLLYARCNPEPDRRPSRRAHWLKPQISRLLIAANPTPLRTPVANARNGSRPSGSVTRMLARWVSEPRPRPVRVLLPNSKCLEFFLLSFADV